MHPNGGDHSSNDNVGDSVSHWMGCTYVRGTSFRIGASVYVDHPTQRVLRYRQCESEGAVQLVHGVALRDRLKECILRRMPLAKGFGSLNADSRATGTVWT